MTNATGEPPVPTPHFFGGAVTLTVSGVAGSATRTLGREDPAGSRLKGTWASPRSTTVYVPGGTLPATVNFTATSVRSAGSSVAGAPNPGGRSSPFSCTFPLKSAQ